MTAATKMVAGQVLNERGLSMTCLVAVRSAIQVSSKMLIGVKRKSRPLQDPVPWFYVVSRVG
jgi:hypothetical protein